MDISIKQILEKFLGRYNRFIITIILPLLTLVLYREILFSNFFLGFSTLGIIFAIGFSIVYLIYPPNFEKQKLDLLIFLNNLKEINIKLEKSSRRLLIKYRRYYRRYKRTGDDKYKYIEKKLFSRFFVNIEWILSLFLLYVPSILIPILSLQFDFMTLILLELSILSLIISLMMTIRLIVYTYKYRKPIERDFNEYVRSLLFPKKWNEYIEKKDVINSMKEFLDKPMWIYPVFIKFYTSFMLIIGLISFLFQF